MKKIIMILLGIWVSASTMAQDHHETIDRVLAAPGSKIRAVSEGAVRLELRGVYIGDGLLWFAVRVRNLSVIDWRCNPMRFFIRDRRVLRRRARQELPLPIVARHESLIVRSDSSVLLCYGLAPRLPRKGQELVLDYGDRNGDRRLILRLRSKDILKAKKLADLRKNGVVFRGKGL